MVFWNKGYTYIAFRTITNINAAPHIHTPADSKRKEEVLGDEAKRKKGQKQEVISKIAAAVSCRRLFLRGADRPKISTLPLEELYF